MRIGKSIVVGLILIGLVVSLNACVVFVKNNPNGHARTQTSASVQYWYYYPNSRVYYHVTEHYYYYPDGKRWRRTRHLPDGWVLNNDYRVRVKLAGKPYHHHVLHQRKYPAKHREAREHSDDKPTHDKNPLRGLGRIKPGNWPGSNKAKHADDHKPDHANANKSTPPGHEKSRAASNRQHKPDQQTGRSAAHGKGQLNKGKGNAVAGKRGEPHHGAPSYAKVERSPKAGQPEGKGNDKSNHHSPNENAQRTEKNESRSKHPMANASGQKSSHSHGQKPSASRQARHSTQVSKAKPTAKDRGERMRDNKANEKQQQQAVKPVTKQQQAKAAGSPKQNDNVKSKQHGKNVDKKSKGKNKKSEDGEAQQADSDAENDSDNAEVAANLPNNEDQPSKDNKGQGKGKNR